VAQELLVAGMGISPVTLRSPLLATRLRGCVFLRCAVGDIISLAVIKDAANSGCFNVECGLALVPSGVSPAELG
jgi:hypothetical protein